MTFFCISRPFPQVWFHRGRWVPATQKGEGSNPPLNFDLKDILEKSSDIHRFRASRSRDSYYGWESLCEAAASIKKEKGSEKGSPIKKGVKSSVDF